MQDTSANDAGLAARINAALPQTQCTRCGYPDCATYAQAISECSAHINQCPPGGAEGIARLSAITGQALLPLSTQHGAEGPRAIAFIDESWCIGCTLCIQACPTDAIVGASKRMHTIIEPYCTGCELCIPVCPVDCIELENASGTATGWAAWSAASAQQARQRYETHRQRQPLLGMPEEESASPPQAATSDDAATRQAAIASALERARQRRKAPQQPS